MTLDSTLHWILGLSIAALLVHLVWTRRELRRDSSGWFRNRRWWWHGITFAYLASLAILTFREGSPVSGWLFTVLASVQFCVMIHEVRAERRASPRRDSITGRPLRSYRAQGVAFEVVAAPVLALVAGIVLQEVAVPPERPLPPTLVGKNVFTLGAGEFVVPQGVDLVVTGVEVPRSGVWVELYVDGKQVRSTTGSKAGHPHPRMDSRTSLHGDQRVASGRTLFVRLRLNGSESGDVADFEQGTRLWAYFEPALTVH